MSDARVLIVEDEALVALDIQRRLEKLGYTVLGRSGEGAQAVQMAEETRADLVLMDIQLEGETDGIEAAGEINERLGIPVVYLTAYSDQKNLERAKITAPFGYLLKPLEERELSIAIEMALYKSRLERELREAKEHAEAATRAKSEFLANVTHELKTPLNSIIGMADLAAELSSDSRQAEYIDIMKSSAKSLLGKINQILSVSKAETTAMKREDAPFCLRELVERSAVQIAVQAHQKGLGLHLMVDPEIPDTLLGDAEKLGQIVDNLLSNAVKFTETGEVSVVARRVSEADGDTEGPVQVLIEVSDSGPGIPAEHREEVFAPFTMLHSGTESGRSGTGVGLYLVRTLTEVLEGEIDVETSASGGASFRVSLMLLRPSASRQSRRPSDEAEPVARSMELLVDSDVLREQVCAWGGQWGISCRTSMSDGERRSAGEDSESSNEEPKLLVVSEARSRRLSEPELRELAEQAQVSRIVLTRKLERESAPAFAAGNGISASGISVAVRTVEEPVTVDRLRAALTGSEPNDSEPADRQEDRGGSDNARSTSTGDNGNLAAAEILEGFLVDSAKAAERAFAGDRDALARLGALAGQYRVELRSVDHEESGQLLFRLSVSCRQQSFEKAESLYGEIEVLARNIRGSIGQNGEA
jgi:signal transduction histidine kinase